MTKPSFNWLRDPYRRLITNISNKYPKQYEKWVEFSSIFQKKVNYLLEKKWIRYSLMSLGGLFLAFSIFFFTIYIGLWGKLPSKNELSNLKQSLATQVSDRNGEVIGKFFIYDRRPIEFNELPKHLISALVATEDARFYEHDGIDKISLLRVFFKTLLLQDDSAGGGSTITQQLAKNLFGRNNQGKIGLVASKFKEFIIAQRLENVYSKNEIINLYFNTVPFPDYTFGIESASQKFFDKHTRDLSLSESATLVGTLKANHSYNPRLFPDRAKQRRNIVLTQMINYGYISQKDTVAMGKDTIRLKYQYYNNQGIAPYFRERLRNEVADILKEYTKPDGSAYDLYRDGLTIQTTLDKGMQTYAETGMKEHMKALQATYVKAYGKYAPWKRANILDSSIKNLSIYKRLAQKGLTPEEIKDSLDKKQMRHIFSWDSVQTEQNVSVVDSLSHYLSLLNCGFMALDPQTGGVLAYIGGINFENFKYDHVSQSKRMVGSTFKPFVYTAALENGMDPCKYYSPDEEIYIVRNKVWTPTNSGGEDDEFTTYSLKGALSNSVNTVAVKVLLDTGIDKVISQAKKMGVESKLPFVPSLALGTAELRVRDLAGAYTPFVNEGKPVKPYYITKISDRTGHVIAEFKPEIKDEKVLSDFTREAMVDMMQATVNEGTATRLRYKYRLKNDIAGKTGTTQDNKDGWFVSVMPKLITVSWVGNDDYRIGFSNTGIGAGANSALPIFAKFMQKMNADSTYREITNARFKKPSRTVESALACESVVKDSTSIKYFFRNIFGDGSSKDKRPIHIDERGRRIEEEFSQDEEQNAQNDEKEDKKRRGFFSFLRKKDKKEDSDDN